MSKLFNCRVTVATHQIRRVVMLRDHFARGGKRPKAGVDRRNYGETAYATLAVTDACEA